MKMTLILGWICLISACFINYGINFICASIFFSAHFIIESINKNNGDKYRNSEKSQSKDD